MKAKSADRVIVALDVSSYGKAMRLVRVLSPVIRHYKVGSELFTACGPQIISAIRKKKAKVFLDLKFHDIPHTVYGAVREACRLGVFMVNVHLAGGEAMIREARRAVRESGSRTRLVGVTVLTSLNERDLRRAGVAAGVSTQVKRMALLARRMGLDGVVASGRETCLIRRGEKRGRRRLLIVTPGIRPSGTARGDQRRVVTPRQAFENGADYIVVGRPITASKNPRDAAQRLLAEIGA